VHFQDVILTLERYWGARRCVLLQPYDLMMGAGTFHPATVLRSLGPQPWRCAYVQPSRRPADARYGDNPNRLGHYYQYQVILKPAPSDVQDLYLGSLEALGIDLSTNDIRFVEDDWESPTLGAWGLGWEVWLNGLEVTQFTYFQQVCGVGCMPVPAELTYGLERLTMALQGVDDVYDLTWVEGVSYRDVFHRNEVEQSKYNFEHSDADALFEEFNRNFQASERLAAEGLALPAYEKVIATSHTFNLLDARGAISVAERAQFIRRIRERAVATAQVWLEHGAAAIAIGRPARAKPPATPLPTDLGPGELFVEVRCEELPASYIRPALAALEMAVLGLIEGVDHGAVQVWATPRRLAVAVAGVASARPVVTRTVAGPPAERAFDEDGAPTKAATGFARGKGVPVEALTVVDGPRGKVVAVEVTEGGERTAELVAAGIDAAVRGIGFPKSMEWGSGGVRWARPIRGVNALYAGAVIPGDAAGVPLGGQTSGHRLQEGSFGFTDSASWLAGLRERWVEPDLAVREAAIRALLAEATSQLGSDPVEDDALLEEVLHLVEAPTLVVGAFDEGLLRLPSRLLIETMKKNQRYFPVFQDGALSNYFVVISNNPEGDAEQIARGNAAVLLARFDDARFFFDEDQKRPLADHGAKLGGMRWIRGLGSMSDKQQRVKALASTLAPSLGADPAVAARAGALCKADLTTQMVGEFPGLQGHMGRLYAAAGGELDAVAVAIEESWLPRNADDGVPGSPAGVATALADRLDTLVGCFGIGMVPKGGDPQGLRRAASGILRIAIERELRLDLSDLVRAAWTTFSDGASKAEAWQKASPTEDGLVEALMAFVLARFRAQAIAGGATADVVDAVLAVTPPDPLLLQRKVDALAALSGDAQFGSIMTTFKRVLNITSGEAYDPPQADALTEDAERALFSALETVESEIADAVTKLDFRLALDRALALQQPVAALFDALLVDDPDPAKRAARKGLLQRVGRSFLAVADFSRISTR